MSCRRTIAIKVRQKPIERFMRLFALVLLALSGIGMFSVPAFAASGITYTGRIVKDDTPLNAGIVRFDVWIKTKDNCVLYYERRNLDMAGSDGTYSFEIGDANITPGTQSFPQTGIQTISDIFNNGKSRANGDVDSSLQCSTFNPTADEGRLMTVSFTPAGETAQALPDLAITAVPTAFQAFNAQKINGYGTGDLLKVDPTVTKTTYANGALTQAQYDEFWQLILGTSTTYLKAIPALGGDISGTLPAVTVTKIQNVAVTAPTTGDTGKVLTYNGTGMVWQTAAASAITAINGLTGATQSFAIGNSGTDVTITSSGSTHTIDVPSASASNRGVLTSADWSTFNAKQSSSLANGSVWIGNASGGAQAQTLSGDATVSASGNVTVDKTQTAQASKILQLDSSGNAYVNGVDIKGSGAVAASIRYTGASNMVMNLPTTSGTANQFLQTDGAGNLSWASQSAMLPAISAGQVWVGNASGGAEAFSLSGDVSSVSNTGLVTLTSSATGSNKLPLAGGTMSGAINMGGQNISNAGDVSLAAGKFLGLGAGSTDGTVAGQIWYDAGVVKYFDGTTVKSLGVAGAGITNLNGLSSGTQSFVVGSAGNAPAISSAGSAHTLDIPMASASGSVTAGLISNADYVSFSGKQSNALAAGQVWVGNASGVSEARALSGDIFSVSNTGLVTVNKTTTAQSNYILALDGSGVGNMAGVGLVNGGTVTLSASGTSATYSLKLPAAAPANNQILKSNATGDLSWVTYLAQVSDSAPLANGKIWIGNASGVAAEVAMSGDATIDNAGLLTLKNTGTVGTYSKVVTDAQGRVVSGSALASGDVTTALGFTPVNVAGDTMAGNLNMGAGNFLGLGASVADGTVAGQIWYDGGAVKYFDGTTAKTLGVAGAGITNLNGLSSGTQSFVVGTAGTDFAITSSGSGHTFDLPSASASNRGALTSADWSTFNAKQSNSLSAASVWVGNASGGAEARALSGDVTIDNVGLVTLKNTGSVGSYYKVVTDAQGRVVSGSTTLGATDLPALNDGTIWIGNSGNTAVGYAMSGDATMSNVGLLTLKNTGSVGTYYKVVTDAQGRVVSGSALASGDVTTALGFTPVNVAGDSMSGDLITQNISMVPNKYFGLSANGTDGTVAGQMWYDAGTIKYFDGTTVKSLGVSGAGITNLNGLSVGTQSFVVGSAGNAPAITSSGSAHTFDFPMASASASVTAGLISNADYVSFSSKQSNALAAGQVWVGNASGAAQAFALSGDIASVSNTGAVVVNKTTTAQSNYILALDGSGVGNMAGVGLVNGGTVTLSASGTSATYSLKLPAAAPANNQILKSNATGDLSWVTYLAQVSDSAPLTNGKLWIGNASGVAAEVNVSGDATMDNAGVMTLKNTGTVGTYSKVVTDAQGRVVSGSALASGDVTTALGFTPVNVAGDTMAGNLNMGAGNFLGLGASAAIGTVAGQIWYDAGAVKYFDGTTAKTLGVAGAGITNLNGLSAGTQSFVVGTAGTDFAITSSGSGHTFDLPSASASNRGALTSTDWSTFNAKQSNALTAASVWVGNASGGAQARALSGDVTIDNVGLVSLKNTGSVGTYFKVVTDAQGRVVSGTSSISNTDLPTLADTKIWIGNSSSTATPYAISGDATMSNIGVLTLKNTGSVGTYWKVITDAQGRVTSGSALASGDVTTALGYTPAAASSGYVNGGNTFAGNATIGLNDAYTLGFKTNNSTRMTITAAGKVGIGTATPLMPLHVEGGAIIGTSNTTFTDAFNFVIGNSNSITNSGGGNALQMMVVGSSNAISTNLSGFSYNLDLFGRSNTVTNAGNAIVLGSGNTTTAANTITVGSGITNSVTGSLQIGALDTAKITILSGGNVGINNTNPTAALDVSSSTGAVRLPIGTTAQRPSNATGLIRYNSSNSNVEFNDGSSWTAFGTGSASLPAISAGQIWVGNSSNGAQAFSLSGDVSSVSNTGSVTINKTTTGANNTILSLDGSGVATAKGLALVNTGTVTVSAATSSSTYGLKLPAASPAANQIMQSDASGNLSWINTPSASLPSISAGKIWVGNASGGPEAFSLSGDIGSVTNTGLVTLKNTGTVGTYWKVITDAQGRVTSGSALASGDVTTALGYIPANGSLSFVNGGNTFAGNATIGLNDAFTLSFKTNNATQMTLDASGKLGIGTTTINNNLSFSGQAAQKIGVERTTTAATAGSNLTMTAGGAYSGGTNLAGGSLILSSGTSTGSGGSDIQLQVATAGTTGSTDRAPATKVTISGTTNSDAMAVSGSIRGTSYDNASSTTIDWSRGNTQYTAAGCTGTQYTFSNMRDGGVYTLAITGTFSASCRFGQTSPDTLSGTAGTGDFYFLPANSTPSGSNAIYSFMRVGNKVYVQWNSGFQN